MVQKGAPMQVEDSENVILGGGAQALGVR